MPFGILVIVLRQRLHDGPLDRLEQLAPADAEAAHLAPVHPLHGGGDRRVALGQREERDVAQPAEDVGLGEADPGLDLGLVARALRPGWQNADAVMRRHRPVAAVHLGIVERGLVDAALEIVGHQQARRRAIEAEHAHVGADPVRQRLRPGRLGVGAGWRRRARRRRSRPCAPRRSPDRRSGPACRSSRRTALSPATWCWRMVGDSRRSNSRNSWQNRL